MVLDDILVFQFLFGASEKNERGGGEEEGNAKSRQGRVRGYKQYIQYGGRSKKQKQIRGRKGTINKAQ